MKLDRKHAISLLAASAAVALSLTLGPTSTADDNPGNPPCHNGTLRGRYAFAIEGQIFPPGAPSILLRGVAMTRFDGSGGLSQLDHTTLNGVPRGSGWRPATGSYAINPDCTGTAEIIPADGSPTLRLYLVIFDAGRQIRTVVDGNATTSLGVRVK